MKLKTNAIRAPKGLSLEDIKAPAPKPIVLTDRLPTEEEIAYSILVSKYPTLEKLVSKLSLVSCTTGKPIDRVVIPEGYQTRQATKLKEIAQKVLRPESTYTREEVLELIATATGVSSERAEIGLALMLEAGAVEQSGERYYLSSSTPF